MTEEYNFLFMALPLLLKGQFHSKWKVLSSFIFKIDILQNLFAALCVLYTKLKYQP